VQEGQVPVARARLAVATAFVALATASSGLAETRVPMLERRLERPAAMAGRHGTSSFAQRSFFLPGGDNAIEFDYFVDSEAGHDFLRVFVADMNTPAWTLSGLNRNGRQRLRLPENGPVRVRFAYVKDAGGSQDADTAWVDDVAVYSSAVNGLLERHRFDQAELALPRGWLGGGFGGGWTVSHPASPRSATRPVGQAGLDGSTSFLERAFTWSPVACPPGCGPWKGAVEFDYAVDSQADHDFLSVYVWPAGTPLPAAPVWEVSGRNRAGHVRLPVSAGSQRVRFAYRKDAAVTEGLDTARVDRIAFRDGSGALVELHDFAAREPGVTPIHAGDGPPEWTSGGAAGGWTVARVTPHTTYVPAQRVGASRAPGWSPFVEPAIDGTITSSELANPTLFRVLDYGNPSHEPAHVALVGSADTGALFMLLRVEGAGAAAGGESGTVTLFVDADREATLRGRGCPADPAAPGSEDPRISFHYEIAGGESLATLSATEQDAGDCAGGFVPAADDVRWSWQAAASEPADDLGFVHLEVRLMLPAGVMSDGRLGLGLLHAGEPPSGSLVRLPFVDDGLGPLPGDVGSWETISLRQQDDPELSEVPSSGCCFPEPSRP
jgi:hypothetical protein